MKTFLWLLIGGPIALLIMALAVINNQPVTLELNPFTPQSAPISVTLPVYALFFIALLAGVAIGGASSWVRQGRTRRDARVNRREAARWRVEAERLSQSEMPVKGLVALPPRKAA